MIQKAEVTSAMHSPLLSDDIAVDSGCEDRQSLNIQRENMDIRTMNRGLRRRTQFNYRNQVIITVLLHLGLVSMHVALFVVYSHHYERQVVIPWTESVGAWVPTALTTLSQLFGTLYLALLLLTTQRLALKRDLNSRQTLTAVHDKNNAWLGLASSVVTMFQQFSSRAALVGVTSIMLYLSSIFLLHITIPTLFHFNPINGTASINQTTQLSNTTVNWDSLVSTQAYDILPVYSQLQKLGLQGNMVYDIIPLVPSATGTVKVNASLYHSDCTALAPVYQQNSSGNNEVYFSGSASTSYALSIGKNSSAFSCTIPYYPMLSACVQVDITFGDPDGGSSDTWSPLAFVSTVPIVDSFGNLPPSSWTSISPHLMQINNDAEDSITNITAVQLVACGIRLEYTTIEVYALTGLPVTNTSAHIASSWKTWTWPENSPALLTDSRLALAQTVSFKAPPDPFINYAELNLTPLLVNTTAVAAAPTTGTFTPELVNLSIATGYINPVITTYDTFLMDDIGMLNGTRENITLDALNSAIEKALAVTYWYGQIVNATNVLNPLPDDNSPGVLSRAGHQGEAQIHIAILEGQLQLSFIPLAIGLISSIALLLLSAYLIYIPAHERAGYESGVAFDSAGILQLTWLLGTEPRLAHVGTPEVGALRKAGMFEVQMSEKAAWRVYVEAVEEEETL